MATTIRGLPTMAGNDLASTIDDTYDGAMTILDGAAFYIADSFSLRPTAAVAKQGTFFKPTDVPGFLYLSDGDNWIEVAPGMGSIPIGGACEYWGTGDPGDTRFVREDGRALSQATYGALYALIGNTYDTMHGAVAPGAGLFRIPNTCGHVIVGAGTSPKLGVSGRALGQTGGEESHALTTAEMPTHNHGGGSHSHTFAASHDLAGGFASAAYAGGGFTNVTNPSGAIINLEGGGQAHNNMPPFVAANRIIRIA